MAQPSPFGKRAAHWTTDEVFQLAEQIHNNPGGKTKRQHVVSDTVLRNFTVVGSKGPRISIYDLTTGLTRDVSTKDAAIEKDFIRIDSFASEQVWGETETLIPKALKAAQSQNVVSQPEELQILRRAIALHFGRSITTLAVIDEAWPRVRERIVTDLLARVKPQLVAMLTKRDGRAPSDDDVMAEIDTIAADGVEKVLDSGAYARVRIEQFYDQALERFERSGVEVVHVPSNDLVITDNPVLLQRPGDERRPARRRLAIDDAARIVFPLASDTLISIGPRNGYGVANSRAVDEINRAQVAGAHRFIYHQPGHNITHLIPAHPSRGTTEIP